MNQDLSSLLPDGSSFEFWERDPVWTRDLHVDANDPKASDRNDGSASAPFRTICRAAELAEPGTRVRIHAGLYRECVRPERGGESPERMVSYEAFGDGPVVISASEEVRISFPARAGSCTLGPGERKRKASASGNTTWIRTCSGAIIPSAR